MRACVCLQSPWVMSESKQGGGMPPDIRRLCQLS